MLEDVVDHTNVGAVFRSAAGIGADAVLVSPRCADPLYRRAVRVSMGTVFQVPWARLDPWPDGVALLRQAGFTVAALALTPDAVSWTTSLRARRSGSPWCSAPRGTVSAAVRWPRPTSRCGSRWPPASTR